MDRESAPGRASIAASADARERSPLQEECPLAVVPTHPASWPSATQSATATRVRRCAMKASWSVRILIGFPAALWHVRILARQLPDGQPVGDAFSNFQDLGASPHEAYFLVQHKPA